MHFAIDADRRGAVRGDHRAIDHHRDTVGHGEYRLHIVLHQQHGMAVAQAVQQVEHARRLLRPHARQRLIEQQHLGLRRRAHRDFELALLPVRQRTGHDPGHAGQTGTLERLVGRGAAEAAALRALHSRQAAAARARCAASRQFSRTLSGRKILLRW